MLNVGLTGGIACGKSTVARMLVRHGAYLIDLDELTHEVQIPNHPAWKEITRVFGTDILAADKKIDRRKLAGLVFADSKKLKTLNKIVHPHVLAEWQSRLKALEKKDTHAIVLSDIPLLFEENLQRLVDLTLLVLIAQQEQMKRLMARNCLTYDEAKKRLDSQMPVADKIKLADIVIDNQGSIIETEKKVAVIWQELLEREKSKN
jgi:dephospho-CoA kinase